MKYNQGQASNNHRDSLIIGNRRVDIASISQKVEQDVNFLSERIELMKQQRNPNPVVLETYESMLASRLSVLDWLEKNEHYTPPEMEQIVQNLH